MQVQVEYFIKIIISHLWVKLEIISQANALVWIQTCRPPFSFVRHEYGRCFVSQRFKLDSRRQLFFQTQDLSQQWHAKCQPVIKVTVAAWSHVRDS